MEALAQVRGDFLVDGAAFCLNLMQPGNVARRIFLPASKGLSTREYPPNATSLPNLGATLH